MFSVNAFSNGAYHYYRNNYGSSGGVQSGSAASQNFVESLKAPSVAQSQATSNEDAQEKTKRYGGFNVVVSGHKYDRPDDGSPIFGNKIDMSSKDYAEFLEYAQQQAKEGNPYTAYMGQIDPLMNTLTGVSWNNGDGKSPLEYHMQPLHHSAEEKLAYNREKAEEFMKMMDVEEQLQAEYGDDVKLVYDAQEQQYIMLRPEDQGYNNTKSVSEMWNQVYVEDIRRGFIDKDGISDILSKYGRDIEGLGHTNVLAQDAADERSSQMNAFEMMMNIRKKSDQHDSRHPLSELFDAPPASGAEMTPEEYTRFLDMQNKLVG